MPCRVASIKDFRASLDFLSGIQGEPHGGPLNLFLGEVSDKDETSDDDINDKATCCEDDTSCNDGGFTSATSTFINDKDDDASASCLNNKVFIDDDGNEVDAICSNESTFCGSADRRGLGANDATFVIVLIIVSSFS